MRVTPLEGGCYVVAPDALGFVSRGNWQEAPVIDRAHGAQFLSSYFVRVGPGRSPVRAYPGSDAVIYVVRGAGDLLIGERRFGLAAETGAYVRPDEAFAIDNSGGAPMELVIGVCPQCTEARWLDTMPETFDQGLPQRTVVLSQTRKEKTADRYFQLLVGSAIGSEQVTQFIGSIPLSKAPSHYHEYEESLTVLSGRGRMWTGKRSTEVGPGSMIFLPRRQVHSLECITPAGMQVMGMFYPAGSPAVSYDS